MSVFNLFKKKNDDELTYSYADLKAHEHLIATFDQAADLTEGRKVTFDTASYPEAVAGLKQLIKAKSITAGTAGHPDEKVDLDGSRISVYRSKTQDHVPVLLLYIDSLFIGVKVAGSERSLALHDAFKEHHVTAVHVEISDDKDPESGCPYKARLIMHEAE